MGRPLALVIRGWVDMLRMGLIIRGFVGLLHT